MTSAPLRRRCCCSSTDVETSCACSVWDEDDCEFTEDGEEFQNPFFPSSIGVSYQRWSLGAVTVTGYTDLAHDNIHATDEDVCTNSGSTELVACEYCSDCVDWDGRQIAGEEIDVNTVELGCTMLLQTGEEPCDGRYADVAAVCVAVYRGTTLEGPSATGESSMFSCPCGEPTLGGESYDWPGQRACWRATLELQKEEVDGEDYAVVTLTLDVGLVETDAVVDCDCNDIETYFGGGFRDGNPMVFRTALGTGESLMGKCGYCFFPWQAFNSMELVSGGDVYPGAPPDSAGSEMVIRSFGDTGVSWGHGDPSAPFDHLGCNIPCCVGAPLYYGHFVAWSDAIATQLDETWTILYWDDDDLDTWYASNPGVYLPTLSGTCASSASWTTMADGCVVVASCIANSSHELSMGWLLPIDGDDDGWDDWVLDCGWIGDDPPYSSGECTAWQEETTVCSGPSGNIPYDNHQGHNGLNYYIEGAFHRLNVSISSSG